MRISAYVLAGDPWWIEDSILAYYSAVDRIVVSYDETFRSWSGGPLPVEDCLDRIRAIDVDGKCEYAPGRFAHPDRDPLECDTAQRNAALRLASPGTDWVLQLDTDEVIGDLDVFLSCLAEADSRGADGMDYPARYLYARTRSGRFLEPSTRWWLPYAHYPGPVVVRPGTQLLIARQAEIAIFRVDFKAWNTSIRHPRDTVVHRVVPRDAGIRHYSWIRSDDVMSSKAGWSGHSDAYTRELDGWRKAKRHPVRTVASAPFKKRFERFRIASLPPDQRYWRGES